MLDLFTDGDELLADHDLFAFMLRRCLSSRLPAHSLGFADQLDAGKFCAVVAPTLDAPGCAERYGTGDDGDCNMGVDHPFASIRFAATRLLHPRPNVAQVLRSVIMLSRCPLYRAAIALPSYVFAAIRVLEPITPSSST